MTDPNEHALLSAATSGKRSPTGHLNETTIVRSRPIAGFQAQRVDDSRGERGGRGQPGEAGTDNRHVAPRLVRQLRACPIVVPRSGFVVDADLGRCLQQG